MKKGLKSDSGIDALICRSQIWEGIVGTCVTADWKTVSDTASGGGGVSKRGHYRRIRLGRW